MLAEGKGYLCSKDPGQIPSKPLTILGASRWDEGIGIFEEAHPEIPLKRLEHNPDEVLDVAQRVLTEDAEADLYLMEISQSQYSQLIEKDYGVD